MDVVYLGSSGSMICFKYPKLKKAGDEIADAIKEFEPDTDNTQL